MKSPSKPRVARPSLRYQSPLGCQLWLEPDDSPERIDQLVARAKDAGLAQLRIFVLWVWIERTPGVFDFSLYDAAFDAAARHCLRIKATLTANSGPWHIGTPGVLHSHTGFLSANQEEAMRRYIREVVCRYRRHAGLGQWLLWNEPHGGSKDHVPDSLPAWREFLRARYEGDLTSLNHRWLTGYKDFTEIPWPEEIAHAAHRSGAWLPYRAELDEMDWRAARLVAQLKWIAAEVRTHDPRTELCYNPIFTIENQGPGATDLTALASVVDRIGSSYHPVFWHTQVRRVDYPGMIAAGVRALAAQCPGKPVELTEVVSGSTVTTGSRHGAVAASELQRFYLAALAAGAETVTGWCLNARRRDGEAGEFSLLNDLDERSERSEALAVLRERVLEAQRRTGRWSAAPALVHVVHDRRSQAIEAIDSRGAFEQPQRAGHGPLDSGRGAWMLAQRAQEQGLSVSNTTFETLPVRPSVAGEVVIVSHLVAWDRDAAARLLQFAKAGGTVVIDALSGRKDLDSAIHKPWPGVISEEIGLRCVGVDTGHEDLPMLWDGVPAGAAVLARVTLQLDPRAGWNAWSGPRFSDGSAVVHERPYGAGRFVHLRCAWGPSLYARPDEDVFTRWMLRSLMQGVVIGVAPAGLPRGGVVVPVACQRGSLFAVLAPGVEHRGIAPLRLSVAPASAWTDLWSGQALSVVAGEISVAAPEGIALLWTSRSLALPAPSKQSAR